MADGIGQYSGVEVPLFLVTLGGYLLMKAGIKVTSPSKYVHAPDPAQLHSCFMYLLTLLPQWVYTQDCAKRGLGDILVMTWTQE